MNSENPKEAFDKTTPCAICGNSCGKLSFNPKGFSIELTGFSQRLVVNVSKTDFYFVKKLYETGGFKEIFNFDLELVPFYCPECKMNYCKNHWDRQITFDEDFYYDAEIGFCPKGHRRMLYD